jgi:predicted RNA-binding protein YlqC (UPF0109 family)
VTQADDGANEMRDLIVQIARSLVDDSDGVAVEPVEAEGCTDFRLRVAPSDVGKVIGKDGRTARSIRTILGAASKKYQHHYRLTILEEAN